MKSFKNFLKALGRKAIGFVRGLNGKKAASMITVGLSKLHPSAGVAGKALEESVGETINKGLESVQEYLKPDEDKPPREMTEYEKYLLTKIAPRNGQALTNQQIQSSILADIKK